MLAQIGYPLTGGGLRDALTVLTVLLFAAASLTAARLRNGTAYAAVLLAVTAVGGFVAEAVGVATGLPFGRYAYAGSLGSAAARRPARHPAGLDDDGLSGAASSAGSAPAGGPAASASAPSRWPAGTCSSTRR